MKKSEYITFRTSEDTKKYLGTKAKEEERTLSWLINKILTEQISKNIVEEKTDD